MGADAIGVGFACAFYLWLTSCGQFKKGKFILRFDEELIAAEEGNAAENAGIQA